MTQRHPAIAHWSAIEAAEPWQYDGHDEPMQMNAAFGAHFGLRRFGIHHARLLPGLRTSFPHAESAEDEFVLVLEGTPDVWLDGVLHRLAPGDGVGFRAGDGLAHSFLNNTDADVRLMIVGDSSRPDNRVVYPLNPEQRDGREDFWDDAPARPLGPHDGLTDARRKALQG